jgi:hypothetical protein
LGNPLPIGWVNGEDATLQLIEFVERIVVSYGLYDIFRGSQEAVLVENDNP